MFDASSSASGCIICASRDAVRLFTKDGFDVARCSRCELVFVSNPPTRDDLKRLYSFDQGYHSKFAEVGVDSTCETAAARRHLADLRRYKAAGRLLDVGCSAGIFLSEARAAGWDVLGVELSADTAEIARRKFGLDVTTGELKPGLFPPGSFDAITMWDVIEHVSNPVAVLATVKQLLSDDGVLLMETPNIDGLFPRFSYLVAGPLDYWPHPEPPGHLFQFSKRTIRRLLEVSGLQTLAIYDRRIPLSYSFGPGADLLRSPKRLAYALAFAPLAAIGPAVRQGDSLVVTARRPP